MILHFIYMYFLIDSDGDSRETGATGNQGIKGTKGKLNWLRHQDRFRVLVITYDISFNRLNFFKANIYRGQAKYLFDVRVKDILGCVIFGMHSLFQFKLITVFKICHKF